MFDVLLVEDDPAAAKLVQILMESPLGSFRVHWAEKRKVSK